MTRVRGLLFVSLLALAGCPKPSSKIAHGEALTTGNAQYDDFFKAVTDLRETAMSAEGDEKAANGLLAKELGIEAGGDASGAVKTADERAKKLKEQGVLLHLEVEPDAKLVSQKSEAKATVDKAGLDLMKGVEESAKAELALEKKLALISQKAQDLEKTRVDLRASAPTAFKDEKQAKRDEIIGELDASADVLTSAGQLGAQAAGRASKFVIELASAVETGASVTALPAGKETALAANGKRTFKGTKPASPPMAANHPPAATPPSAKPPPAAKPPPPKKGKGGDDFEP